MIPMGDAVPQTLWDLSLSAGLADFALAKFRALSKIEMLARRIELSRDGTRAPTQVRTGGLKTASHVTPFHLQIGPDFLSNRWGPPQLSFKRVCASPPNDQKIERHRTQNVPCIPLVLAPEGEHARKGRCLGRDERMVEKNALSFSSPVVGKLEAEPE